MFLLFLCFYKLIDSSISDHLTFIIEYSLDQYKRNGGKVSTSSDGYKYLMEHFTPFLNILINCGLFLSIGRHTIPAIHCLLTNKDEELYRAVLEKIREIIPQLEPGIVMSDCEQATRNAFKQVYPGIRLNGF